MTKHWTMSASRCLPTVLLLATGLVYAEDPEDVPDADFLEYLGMWDGSDETWTLFDEEPVANTDGPVESVDGFDINERREPAPDDESTERDDEG